MNKSPRRVVVVLNSLFIASCANAYEMPNISKDIEKTWTNHSVVDSLPITKGILSLFKDEQLDSLVVEAVRNNYDVKAAQNRLLASTQSNATPGIIFAILAYDNE